MIVRNEAAHLPACLESIREVVDEIVIVDTGSTDETVAIARAFGARLHVHPWRGSFAEPRNVALDLARGKWILYIDADERLRPCSYEVARARIAEATEVALRVRLRPFVGATPFWEYRLWRSDPRIRFAGVIHEKQTAAIAQVAAADGVMVGESDLFLEHVGYEGDQTRKHERNLPLLRAQLAADPTDTYNWHHLAVVLEGLGKPDESEVALERAVDAARQHDGGTGMQPFARLICLRRERGQDTTELLDEALTRYPDNIGLHWLKVIEEIELGRYEQALRRLELFDVDTEMPVEDIVGYRGELFGARAAEARGVCLFKLGRYADAAMAYGQAERLEPHERAHGLKRVVAEARSARQMIGSLPPPEPAPVNGYRWAARELLAGIAIDIGGVSLALRATDAVRAAAMHALLGRMTPADHVPDAEFTFCRHRVPPPERAPDDSAGGLSLWNDDERFSIALHHSVAGRVEDGRALLGGHARHLAVVFRYVAPFMLASLLAPHGRLVLHGGAICRDGGAVLVLGATGSGKSTLILGAVREGWTVLADDLVTLSIGARGSLVSGIPRPLVVPSEVMGGNLGGLPRADDPRARVELPFEDWDRSAYPVSAIVVAGHGEGHQAAVQPIDRLELVGILLRSMLCQQPRHMRRFVSMAAALSDLPARRLLHSRTPQNRPQQALEALQDAFGAERSLPLGQV
jgi:tetratricopeptide (TPR) repeat protein